MNAKPRAVAKNAVSGYITLALGALLGFILTPILLSRLGTTGFGTWSLILGTVAYLSLLDAGLGFATTTRISAVESEGSGAMSRVLSTSLGLYTCIAAGGLLVTFGVVALFPLMFDVPEHLVRDSRVALMLMGVWQMVMFLSTALTACLIGTGRMYLVNFSGLAVAFCASAAQGAALLLGGGLIALAGIQLAGSLATLVAFRWQLRRTLPSVRLRMRAFHRPTANRLLGLGWRNSVFSVASLLAFGSDIVLVGLLLDANAAASYAIALRAYTLLQRMSTGVLGAMGPAHAHAAHHSTPERRFRLYCLATLGTLCFAAYGAFAAGIFAPSLLLLWLGTSVSDAPSILVVLCAVLLLHGPGLNAASLLLASEQASELMRITLLAAALNVVASVVLTLTAGIMGPALGSLIAVTAVDAVYLPWRICRMLGQPYSELVRRVLLPLALPLSLLLGILVTGKLIVGSGPGILGIAAIGALVYFTTLWHMPTGREIRFLLRRESMPAI